MEENIRQQVAELQKKFTDLSMKFNEIVIGQEEILQLLNIAILSQGHSLITGAPGLAKTLAIKTISKLLDLEAKRIQFTPDLLPSDIIGIEILDIDPISQKKDFRYIQGPVFTNVLLADEINRATPRTQSALLEAMQEKGVSIGGKQHELQLPFITFATRNPIDSEGVYPLPEAQLDRFLLEILVPYPKLEHEIQISATDPNRLLNDLSPVIHRDELLSFQNLVDAVPVSESVLKQAVTWVRKTRPDENKDISDVIAWGAGPRAASHLIKASRAYALLYGNGVVEIEIIKKMFLPVMRHRIVTSAIFQRSGKEVDEILSNIITS